MASEIDKRNKIDMLIQLPHDFEDDILKEIFKSNIDLRQYSEQIEKELAETEDATIQDYLKESDNIMSLHNQMTECDNILEVNIEVFFYFSFCNYCFINNICYLQKMENVLLTFQSDLGSVTNEILYLQKKSVEMSQQLVNRQAIRAPLSQFIEDIAVSEELIA